MADRPRAGAVRFAPALRDDFFRLHSEARGTGWCYCVAWWVPTWDGWGERTAAANRGLREELCARGEYDGYLYYADGDPVGWCQAGPRDRLAKLVRQLELEPDPGAWALTCFLVAPEYRRQGVAARMLGGVLDELRGRGVARVEAYPRRDPAGADALDLWTGPEPLLHAAGFRVHRDTERWRIMAVDLDRARPAP